MLKAISKFETTAIVPADSQGPYVINAGSPVLLSAGNTHPDATYHWELGDGAVATTANVTHTYVQSGTYIAKLKVTVNQPGGAVSRHFAMVTARNVPPVVDAGADRTVDEGDVVPFVGTFTDVEYPDTHEATWDWGDYQKPDAGVVTETNAPPQAEGTVTGSHAWGDNGTYTVRLTVRDSDGGVGEDTLTMTVLNVPPTVDAGQDLYAYPCSVLTLAAKFTDPGWLDTHVGTWDFGDCSRPQTAVIREEHKPPKGIGVAIASHKYKYCGSYAALCTVVDDDGGVGADTVTVHVVDVLNPGFEGGFRAKAAGAVGNDWDPYQADIPVFAAPPARELDVSLASGIFEAEEFCVREGQRSQRIRFDGATRFGVRQQVGANEGWDYAISAWYSIAERAKGVARLGIDPTGGTDPTAASVVWSPDGTIRGSWEQLAVRATAPKTGHLTIFLEAQGAGAEACDIWFDDVALVPVQPFCPDVKPPEPEKPEPPRPTRVCVNFDDQKAPSEHPPRFKKDGFVFENPDGSLINFVAWGDPPGRPKLVIRPGLRVTLPFVASRVIVTLFSGARGSLEIVGLDSSNTVVAHVVPAPQTTAQTVNLAGASMTSIEFRRPTGEDLLIEVCAVQERA